MNARTRRRYITDDSRLLLDAYPQDLADGLSQLSLSATLNGVTVNPFIAYNGNDAGTTWPSVGGTYGEALALVSSGADPYKRRSPLLSGDQALQLTGGKIYQAPTAATGQIATEDFLIEAVIKLPLVPANFGTWFGTDGDRGWWFNSIATGIYAAYNWRDEDGAPPPQATGTLTTILGSYAIVAMALNRDGRGQTSINGLVANNFAASRPKTLTGTAKFTIGGSNILGAKSNGAIISIRGWKAADWFTADDATFAAQILAWHRERFYTLLGAIPKGRLYSHVTHTRTTGAYSEVDGRFYSVGANWPRAGRRGGHVGFMPGATITNVANGFTYSADFAAQWGKGEAGDVVALSAVEGPIDAAPWSHLICDATTSDAHYLSASLSPANPYQHTMSVIVKKGTARWLYLGMDHDGTGSPTIWAYFDLLNGVVGSKTAHASSLEHAMRPLVDSAGSVLGYQCWYRYDGPAAAHLHAIGVSDADGDPEYSGGDGAVVDLYLCHAQHGYDCGAPGDIWVTTGSAGSPGADSYYVDVTGLLGATGRIETRHLALPNSQQLVACTVASLNKAGSAADSVQHCSANLTTQQPETILTATGGTARTVSPAVDIYDDTGVVIARSTWKAGRAAAEAAGVGAIITTPVAADIPAGLTRLAIGHTSGLRLPGGLIGSVKLFNK